MSVEPMPSRQCSVRWVAAALAAVCVLLGCPIHVSRGPNSAFIWTPCEGDQVAGTSVFVGLDGSDGDRNRFSHLYYSVDGGPQQEVLGLADWPGCGRAGHVVLSLSEGSHTIQAWTDSDVEPGVGSNVAEVSFEVVADPTKQAPTAAAGTLGGSTTVPAGDVTLVGSSSSDPDGSIARHMWYYGNGRCSPGDGPPWDPTVNFSEGTYTVRLYVVDDDGLYGEDSFELTVTP